MEDQVSVEEATIVDSHAQVEKMVMVMEKMVQSNSLIKLSDNEELFFRQRR